MKIKNMELVDFPPLTFLKRCIFVISQPNQFFLIKSTNIPFLLTFFFKLFIFIINLII